jgi:hypothetical protein
VPLPGGSRQMTRLEALAGSMRELRRDAVATLVSGRVGGAAARQ